MARDQGIDVAVLALSSPGVQGLPEADALAVAREANDQLAKVVASWPDRFRASAAKLSPRRLFLRRHQQR
ncbi:hypothetical protein ABR737_09565 [Streptomyces sp. Edi2]|uniref:hypothetical protein n=1 Tax=Streptomyces sp. Edi2 TaxID=3162528 RepID=UPI003305CCDD